MFETTCPVGPVTNCVPVPPPGNVVTTCIILANSGTGRRGEERLGVSSSTRVSRGTWVVNWSVVILRWCQGGAKVVPRWCQGGAKVGDISPVMSAC